MQRSCKRIGLGLVLLLFALGLVAPAIGQAPSLPEGCQQLAFSVEQSFLTQGPAPPDGNPLISDGDLLGLNCVLCARNRDLIRQFDIQPNVDLGLDAVDVVEAKTYLLVFSTELDSPNRGQFTAGDLLTPNGVVIPNVALTHGFAVGYDIGLDALHLVGDLRGITGFLGEARDFRRSDWLSHPDQLARMLRQWEIDIWFSTEEGVATPGKPGFLDGDLLSARDGVIVAANSALLPVAVPAGIPNRGVDFGLDAAAGPRLFSREDLRLLRFSTELLFEGKPPFTDGDVLAFGNGVALPHRDLIRCFEPKAEFLGLDALSGSTGVRNLLYFQLILKRFPLM